MQIGHPVKNNKILTEYVIEWKEPNKIFGNFFKGKFKKEKDILVYLQDHFLASKHISWITKIYACNYTTKGRTFGREYLTNSVKVLFDHNTDKIYEYLNSKRREN